MFPLHLRVIEANILRSFIKENKKNVQKLNVDVADPLHQFINWQQEQAGSCEKCIHLQQVSVAFYQVHKCPENRRAVKKKRSMESHPLICR